MPISINAYFTKIRLLKSFFSCLVKFIWELEFNHSPWAKGLFDGFDWTFWPGFMVRFLGNENPSRSTVYNNASAFPSNYVQGNIVIVKCCFTPSCKP